MLRNMFGRGCSRVSVVPREKIFAHDQDIKIFIDSYEFALNRKDEQTMQFYNEQTQIRLIYEIVSDSPVKIHFINAQLGGE